MEGFNTEMYEKFRRGQKLVNAGGILCGLGLGAVLGGVIVYALADEPWEYTYATACIVVGNILIIPGIPLSAAGGATKKSVQNEYREKYLTHSNPKGQFQLQLSGNGLGLAYVF